MFNMESLEDVKKGRFDYRGVDLIIAQNLASRLTEANPARKVKAKWSSYAGASLIYRPIGPLGLLRRSVIIIKGGAVWIYDSSFRQDVEKIVPEINEASGKRYDIQYCL